MYVSALQLPISAFSNTFDCKDTEKKQNGIKKTIVLFVTYHKMNKKLLLSAKQIQQIQPRLTPRGFSVELLHTDCAEDTGLELENVIIKKEHPSLLFQPRNALLVDYQYYTL